MSLDMISFAPHSKHCSGGFAAESQNGIELGAGVVGGGVVASTVYMYSTYITTMTRNYAVIFTFVQGGRKMAQFLYALTSSNINRFSNLFHCQNQEKICVPLLKIPPHLKCVATLPCEMSSVLKATIENNTTSVTTHLHMSINKQQGTACLLSQLLSKVTVTSCRSSAGISCTDICGRTARRHTLRGTHRRTCELRRENVTFIEPHMWPPNSPDLNAVDCAVCCPSTDGLSTSTIQDNQPAEAGNRH